MQDSGFRGWLSVELSSYDRDMFRDRRYHTLKLQRIVTVDPLKSVDHILVLSGINKPLNGLPIFAPNFIAW
jgi:hypothetical protein